MLLLTVEATKAAAERSVREAISQVKKLQLEQCELINKTTELRTQVTIQKIRKDALAAQLVASRNELNELQVKFVSIFFTDIHKGGDSQFD